MSGEKCGCLVLRRILLAVPLHPLRCNPCSVPRDGSNARLFPGGTAAVGRLLAGWWGGVVELLLRLGDQIADQFFLGFSELGIF